MFICKLERFDETNDLVYTRILKYELISGQPPFIDRQYDIHLAFAVCDGERPPIPEYAPEPYVTLLGSYLSQSSNDGF